MFVLILVSFYSPSSSLSLLLKMEAGVGVKPTYTEFAIQRIIALPPGHIIFCLVGYPSCSLTLG